MDSSEGNENDDKSVEFKKPVFVAKAARLTKKEDEKEAPGAENDDEPSKNVSKKDIPPLVPLSYKCPSWSGLPTSSDKPYKLEVLKSGKIIEEIDLMSKEFWVFGRLENCDISMAHPTVSRYHAVLQFRKTPTEDEPSGFYLYDLNSTHGTFLNKNRVKSQIYGRVQVGHMISIGCSTRQYILTGPDEDAEEESQLTITELKQLREEKIQQRQKEIEDAAKEAEIKRKKQEEAGIDWGMGEDADENTDLSENPFAQTNNEELYLEDPKKALRGFMEREGFDLDYDCTEQGMGQFLCKVVLPLDDDKGRPIIAEVLHKGKKKEAVVQCALEACRILDRHGVLRQANHESRKRKAKNWEENDFYDSDDDTFLDRTGTVEKKRENRMKAKLPQQAETYNGLLEKEKKIADNIKSIEKQLADSQRAKDKANSGKDEDSLDSYMSSLNPTYLDKDKIFKLKSELTKLKSDHAQVIKMVNIAKPADLPPLKPEYSNNNSNKIITHDKKGLPLFGKRHKSNKIKLPQEKPQPTNLINVSNKTENDDEEIDDEKMEVDEEENKDDKICDNNTLHEAFKNSEYFNDLTKLNTRITEIENKDNKLTNNINSVLNIWVNLKRHESTSDDDLKSILVNLQSRINERNDMLRQNLQLNSNVLNVVNKILIDINNKKAIENTQTKKVVEGGEEDTQKRTTTAAHEVGGGRGEEESELIENDQDNQEKRKKKNQKRYQHRSEKAQIEKLKGYEEDANKEDYNMWVPPQGQSGDGRTSLNEKLGY